jgi:hypothetical protein
MHHLSDAELLLQLSNIELYVALYGIVLGGLFAVNEIKEIDPVVLWGWRVAAVLCALIAVFLVIWLASALAIRWAILVGLA